MEFFHGFIKNKKGNDLLSSVVIFFILNVLFFSSMFIFLGNVAGGSRFMENIYSKKIALTIDNLRPGTEISIPSQDLFNAAEKNGLSADRILEVDYLNKNITVRVDNDEGKTYAYFNDLSEGSISIDQINKVILIKT